MKKFKFKIQGNPYEVEVKNFEDSIATVEVNGTSYEVQVEKQVTVSKTPTLIRKPVKVDADSGKIKKSSGSMLIKAPLPGNIMQVSKKTGDPVKMGEMVVIYEAMKMENQVLAEKDGTIGEVKVAPGDAVLQGDVLFEIL
jgi:biotin carboxyl carrier protein